MQLAAYESAQLAFAPDGRIEGNSVAHSRLASVLQKSIRWYSVAAVLMAATLLPAGLHFFGKPQHVGRSSRMEESVVPIGIGGGADLPLDPVFAFIEGCGFVSQIARMRLAQALLGSLLAWTALTTHHGLYSPAMVILDRPRCKSQS